MRLLRTPRRPRLRRRTRFVVLAALGGAFLVLACQKAPPAPTLASASPEATAAPEASAENSAPSPAPRTDASAAPSSAPAAAVVPVVDEAGFTAALEQGRALAKARKYSEAATAFGRALDIHDDPRARAERGYARHFSHDETGAASDLALAAHTETDRGRLSEIWFHRGLVAAAGGDGDARPPGTAAGGEETARRDGAGAGAFAVSYEFRPSKLAKDKLGGDPCIVQVTAYPAGGTAVASADRVSQLDSLRAGCVAASGPVTDATPLPVVCTTGSVGSGENAWLIAKAPQKRVYEAPLGGTTAMWGRSGALIATLRPTAAGWVSASSASDGIGEAPGSAPGGRGTIDTLGAESIAFIHLATGDAYLAHYPSPAPATEENVPRPTFTPSAAGLRVDGLGCHGILATLPAATPSASAPSSASAASSGSSAPAAKPAPAPSAPP